jgi:hypothetical protein
MSNIKKKLEEQTNRETYRQAQQYAPQWIENTLAGKREPIPEGFRTRFLQRARALQLVPALAQDIQDLGWEEARRREILKRSTAAEEASRVAQVLGAEGVPCLLAGELAVYLAQPEQAEELTVHEVQVWVESMRFWESMRALGKAGYQVSQAHQRMDLEGIALLRARPGAPRIRLVRYRNEQDRQSIAPRIWEKTGAARIPGLPETAGRLNASDLLVEVMREFSEFQSSALRSLVTARVILRSGLAQELDWLRVTKVLAETGDLGRSLAGFRILAKDWKCALGEPLAGLVESRSSGITGELLRGLFSVQAFVRGGVSPVRKLLGRWTALRPAAKT